MKIKVLGCYGGQLPGKHNSGFLLNGDLLIDAGTVGLAATLQEQRGVRNVLISHPHLDHLAGLPFFAVNIVSNKADTVRIAGSKTTVDAIRKHLMNGLIWPDFTKIKNFGGNYIFGYQELSFDKWYKVGGYNIKAVPVNHTVPANGFIIGKGNHYIMYSGDTKSTDKIWQEARKLGRKLKSVFAEISFPDELGGLADASAHLTPGMLGAELKKLGKLKPKIFVYHIKPEYASKVRAQLRKVKGYRIQVLQEKKTYSV